MTDGDRQRDLYPVLPNDRGLVPISPTDVSQFIRLEQCQRFLRLHLHEGTSGSRFLRDYGVRRQEIQPLLTRSGVDFEAAVVAAVREHDPLLDLAHNDRRPPKGSDNDYVLSLIRDVAPGEVLILYQPRVEAEIDGWRIRGDIDLLRVTRDETGTLYLLITDIKSSAEAKVEHRLQIAFYHEILAALLHADTSDDVEIATAVLYRGTAKILTGTEEDAARAKHERQEAARLFNVADAYLELIADAGSYRTAVRDLITSPGSLAYRIRQSQFTDIPYHLSEKCDGCLYNEFCMTWSARHDDLSLLPHLTEQEKGALRQAGIEQVRTLATLKEASVNPKTGQHDDLTRLVPASGEAARVQRLSAIWPVGPHLDELIHRARAYRRFKGDAIGALPFIPSKGHGSLPYADAGHNPNLVRVYLDAQRDYLNDRVYLLGALVVGSERGEEPAPRRRQIVRLSEEPPVSDEIEARLLVDWVQQTLRAIVEVAAPDETGAARAPIHLIFFNSFAQKDLLEALSRHSPAVLGATPLYDFMTQIAAFDSPIVSYLDREIRELKNYPMVCQSLQAVAARLGFQWNGDVPYRDRFKTRLFDFWRKADEPHQDEAVESPWYFGRARFSSQIPLEYATAAWGELPVPKPGERDEFAAYRGTTPPLLEGFAAKRLDAMEWIAKDFTGNKLTAKKPFDLPELAEFDDRARGLAEALEEFLLIERHVELGAWKTARLLPPERRVLAGTTLLARYDEADQTPETVERNRQNQARYQLAAEQAGAYRAAHPDEPWVNLSKEEKKLSDWSPDGLRVRLALDIADVDCGLDEALAVTTLRAGDRVVVMPRWTVDSRVPVEQQALQTPTPRQMLYGGRAEIREIAVDRDETGRATGAIIELEMKDAFGGARFRGFAFGDSRKQPFDGGERYTIDADPNDWASYQGLKVVEGLIAGQPNTLFDRLTADSVLSVAWPEAAEAGQARFLAGLDALADAGLALGFEPDQRAFVAGHGDAPTLLVQGPPGTGKSYTTAYALFARIQGAMAADREFRVQVGCKTHAATDVLLENLVTARERLATWQIASPEIFAEFFDPRLLDLPLFRFAPRADVPDGVIPLPRKADRPPGATRPTDAIAAARWCVVAATPGGVYRALNDRWGKAIFGRSLTDCLVLDEASQMSLPEALMAALPLKPAASLIVVGDHRQMPPIVKHDWEAEPRRTFLAYQTYRSLFETLRRRGVPMVQFARSFRLHTEMAEFLRQEIYWLDGIAYHSRRRDLLAPIAGLETFVEAVLTPEHPLVVVVHDERSSQLRNQFEQRLITPVLQVLAAEGFNATSGIGVVVPHRAQRALVQDAMRNLPFGDDVDPEAIFAAVDTVERFQGGERKVILISATESDPAYLLAAGKFLYDPRRLTVALSRATHKLVLIASRSVFDLFSADEEMFQNAQLWKHLLRRTCTVPLWADQIAGTRVEVWGNAEAPLLAENAVAAGQGAVGAVLVGERG